MRALFLLVSFSLTIFGAFGLQWIYYYSSALMVIAAGIGLPAFSYLNWRYLYNSGCSGTPIQRRFGPIFLACFQSVGLYVSAALLNQQGSHEATLVTGELESGYNSPGGHVRGFRTVAHSQVEFTLEGSSDVYSVRAPLVHMGNHEPGNIVYICKKKGLLFFTYYELTALDMCVEQDSR